MGDLLIHDAKALVGTHPAGTALLRGEAMRVLPQVENGWLWAENGRIKAFGQGTPPAVPQGTPTLNAAGRYLLPGWCDPHTHTVFAAPREGEFVDRINGLDYQAIAAKGGGILNSALRLRTLPEEELFQAARERLAHMMRQGTVAVEIKSGYGLDLESELKMLRVVKRLKAELPLQIKATLLAAHAIPPEYKQNRAGWMKLITDTLIPLVAKEGLADFVDCFCETNYFTVQEMEDILVAGAAHGLPGKVHVNQFTSIGGVQAAARQGALSVDHLEVMEPQDLEALSGSSTIPTLLPSCSFFLRIPYAPARAMLQAGLPVALATDLNPGTTPSGNMNLVLSLACIQLRMLPEEAFNAATLNAAAAMHLAGELGSLAPGKRASFILTEAVPSLAYLPYAFGRPHIDNVIIDGRIL
jgi:imidazolonepropionase